MTLDRRRLVTGLVMAPALLAAREAAAAPILSETNHGLTLDKVQRGNGWLEIDAAGFEANIGELRKLLKPGTQICAVLKADAYGHGIDLLMPSIIRQGIGFIGITSNEEARVARALGFKGRIMRLRTATLEEIEDGFAYAMEELIGNLDHAKAVARLAKRHGQQLEIHFALNSTGMSRNGLDLGDAQGKAEAQALIALDGLKIAGIMCHFPVEDVADVRASLSRFLEESEWVIAAGKLDRKAVLCHACNTYATQHVPEAHLDLVRVGGALVGDTYPAFPQFKKIMTAKSRVASINRYPAGATVSYDRTWKLQRESWLANIPAGYSDGYRRQFSSRNQPQPDPMITHVLIRGHRLPVIGRVTMNTMMVDVTDVRDQIRMEDEVVFLGRQGAGEITQRELETAAGTLGAELFTILGNSLPKVLKV